MDFHKVFSQIYEGAAKRMCLDCSGFIKEGDKVLDFGCGSGIVAKIFQDFFKANVLGVDIKDNRIFPVPFKLIKGDKLTFKDLNFDVILISYVLHHTQDPEKILKEAKRVAKRIIVYEDLSEGFFAKLICWCHEMSYKLLFQRVGYQFSFKTEKEWKELFDKMGLRVVVSRKPKTRFGFLDPVKRILFILEKV